MPGLGGQGSNAFIGAGKVVGRISSRRASESSRFDVEVLRMARGSLTHPLHNHYR